MKVATTTRLPTRMAFIVHEREPQKRECDERPQMRDRAKAATATIRSAPHSAGDSHPGNKLKLEKATELMSTHPKSAKMRNTRE